MQCSRAFGALITMRDDPMDAEPPEKFEPSDYHSKGLAEDKAELESLECLSTEQRAESAAKANDDALARWETRKQERIEQRQRYDAMLAQAKAWKPPTSDHVGLRDFMIDQLRNSIDIDCNGRWDMKPEIMSTQSWYEHEISALKNSIERHEEGHKKEIARAKKKTSWLNDLRASLQPQ